MSFRAGLKVTRIVEDVVLGQQCLVGEAEQFLVANDGGGVEEASSGGQLRTVARCRRSR